MDPEGLNEPVHSCGILKEETNKQNELRDTDDRSEGEGAFEHL